MIILLLPIIKYLQRNRFNVMLFICRLKFLHFLKRYLLSMLCKLPVAPKVSLQVLKVLLFTITVVLPLNDKITVCGSLEGMCCKYHTGSHAVLLYCNCLSQVLSLSLKY